jgi:hypothetical protein
MIENADIVQLISYLIGSFSIGYVSGLLILVFKKSLGLISR